MPPEKPNSPDHLVFNFAGLILGAGIGVGLALAREFVDDTFADEATLVQSFPGIPTIITIPHLTSDALGQSESEVAESTRAIASR